MFEMKSSEQKITTRPRPNPLRFVRKKVLNPTVLVALTCLKTSESAFVIPKVSSCRARSAFSITNYDPDPASPAEAVDESFVVDLSNGMEPKGLETTPRRRRIGGNAFLIFLRPEQRQKRRSERERVRKSIESSSETAVIIPLPLNELQSEGNVRKKRRGQRLRDFAEGTVSGTACEISEERNGPLRALGRRRRNSRNIQSTGREIRIDDISQPREKTYEKNSRKEKDEQVRKQAEDMQKEVAAVSDRLPTNIEGKQITFSSSEDAFRTIQIDDSNMDLFYKYMTQPVEEYSVLSFHDEGDTKDSTTSRRWIVRRLTKEESLPYLDNTDNGDRNHPLSDHTNFFRLAVPIMPLVGIDITPVMDLEVFSRASTKEQGRFQNIRNRIDEVRNGNTHENNSINIRSLRVSLLSTNDEVDRAMGNNNKHQREAPSSTITSHESLLQMGAQAIGLVGKLGDILEPHLTFEARVKWSDLPKTAPAAQSQQVCLKVNASVETSLKVPTDLPVPLPPFFLIKTVGSMVIKRVMGLLLPKFLKQLQRDFERWANISDESDGNASAEEEKPLTDL